jgi:hypothetical protein
VQRLAEEFRHVWERSSTDTGLRRLHL